MFLLGANYLQDVQKIMGNAAFEAEIARIPGQSSGLSTRYFYMLAGDENFIKPDRMIRRFIQSAIHRELSFDECQELLVSAHAELVRENPPLTTRSLDHQIWLYQKAVKEKGTKSRIFSGYDVPLGWVHLRVRGQNKLNSASAMHPTKLRSVCHLY
ncbi:MAG: hypothetical protein RBT01_16575 [Anaerolineaceae bacterium]|jgi:hypothetical protein|nr:hypothetical protein [Anaerolineaceae bacterium]